MEAIASPRRTVSAPVVALLVLAAVWGRALPPVLVLLVGATLIAAVLVAVHHAEVGGVIENPYYLGPEEHETAAEHLGDVD